MDCIYLVRSNQYILAYKTLASAKSFVFDKEQFERLKCWDDLQSILNDPNRQYYLRINRQLALDLKTHYSHIVKKEFEILIDYVPIEDNYLTTLDNLKIFKNGDIRLSWIDIMTFKDVLVNYPDLLIKTLGCWKPIKLSDIFVILDNPECSLLTYCNIESLIRFSIDRFKIEKITLLD